MNIQQKRLSEGKCKLCENPLKTSKLCSEHAEKAAKAQREIVNKRRQSGLCIACGRLRGISTARTMCQVCADNLKNYAANDKTNRKARGQCRQCSNPIATGKS